MDKNDASNLRLAGLLHYVLAAIGYALTTLFAVMLIGVIASMGAMDPAERPELPMRLVICLLGAAVLILAYGLDTLLLLAGGWLRQRRGWTWCFAAACVDCLFIPPAGAVLGLCTMLLLIKPAVRTAFEGQTAPREPPVVIRPPRQA